LIEIVAATLIPLLAGYIDAAPVLKYIIGSLGVIITILEGLSSLNKYQENWIQYRVMAEALTKERFLFLTQSRPYNGSGAFA
jgi:hypothetical protein